MLAKRLDRSWKLKPNVYIGWPSASFRIPVDSEMKYAYTSTMIIRPDRSDERGRSFQMKEEG